MFTPHYVSHVTCHMSHVSCHVSGVMCQVSCVRCHVSLFSFFFSSSFLTKWWSLSGEGLLSTGPTPSSFLVGHLIKITFVTKHINPVRGNLVCYLWSVCKACSPPLSMTDVLPVLFKLFWLQIVQIIYHQKKISLFSFIQTIPLKEMDPNVFKRVVFL